MPITRRSARIVGGPGKAALLNREILIKKEIEDLLELSRAGKLRLCDDGGDADLMCSGPGVDGVSRQLKQNAVEPKHSDADASL